MTKLQKTLRLTGFAGVLGLAMNSHAAASVMYTVQDLGPAHSGQVGFFGLFGQRFLHIDEAGHVDDRITDADPATYSGPVPAGMGPRVVHGPHASPDGQYLAGTTYASASPAAAWAGYVVHNGIANPLVTLDNSYTYSTAFAVNNGGTVVGSAGSTTGPAISHAIVVDPSGKVTDLGTLGGSLNAALGINSKGTIVGEGQVDGAGFGAFRAFVSDGHGMTDLNALIAPIPGFQLVSASAINDLGQIAAYGRLDSDYMENYREILLSPVTLSSPTINPMPLPDPTPVVLPLPQPSPVPEPATAAMFGLIVGAAGWRTWRKRPQR